MWDDIHDGMYRVVQTHRQFDGLGVDVAGKTGTAELNIYHPTMVCLWDMPRLQILNMRLQCVLRMDILPVMRVLQLMIFFKYIFELTDEKSILTGVAASGYQ